MTGRHFEVNVAAYDLTDDEADALFDRVATAAHALGQDIIGSGRWVDDEDG